MQQQPRSDGSGTLDAAEVDRFAKIASEWWDPNGKFRPLHKLGPARLTFILDHLTAHFHLPSSGLRRVEGLSILDIGCGGGLMCEPLARLGARVMGVDPAVENIEAAIRHADTQALPITYRAGRAEDLAGEKATFDAVLCLEVIEHVPDVASFIGLCAKLVRPGGILILSTINRTLKAYLLAIVGAEYVLRWLPVGTHQWDRFVTPEELGRHLAAAGLHAPDLRGLVYNVMADSWSLSGDTDVNYMAAAARPA